MGAPIRQNISLPFLLLLKLTDKLPDLFPFFTRLSNFCLILKCKAETYLKPERGQRKIDQKYIFMLQQTSKLKKSKRERCEQSWSKYLAAAQCGLCSKGSCLLSGQKSLVLQVLRKEGEATPGDQRVRVSDQSDQVLCLKLKSQATTVVSIFDLGSRFCNLYLRSVPVHPSYWLRHRIILT